jgi:hypothetical protein
LQIKLHQLHAYRRDVAHTPEPTDPGDDVGYPTLQRWWQPALWPASILPLGLAISGMTVASASAHPVPIVKVCFNLLTTMGKLYSKDDFTRLIVHDRYSSGLTPRINLDPQFCDIWIIYRDLEDDSERITLQYSCLPSGEEQSRLSWMDRVQRLLLGIDDENVTQFLAPFPLRASGYPGNGSLDDVRERFNVKSTGTNPCNPV